MLRSCLSLFLSSLPWRHVLWALALLAGVAQAQLALPHPPAPVNAWPAVRMLVDDTGTLDVQGARAALERFTAIDPAHASLGVRPHPVWLYLPVHVSGGAASVWVLDINYPALNRVDVFLEQGEAIAKLATLGNLQPFAQRPLGGRSLAVPMELDPVKSPSIWLRVETAGALVLPLTLSPLAEHQRAALDEQMLQGLLSGLALCLLVYSLAQWLTLRDTLFLKYALLITGSLGFSVFQFGLGTQFLWTDAFWFERHAAGLMSLTATTGSFLFIEHALRGGSGRTWQLSMRAGAVLSVLLALVYAMDLVGSRAVTAIMSVLGLLPALLGLPGAWRRARQGDTIGACFLAAWLIYALATATIIGVIRGVLPVNFFTLHAFQFGATLDMLLFMRVLGLRTRALQLSAQTATRERDAMVSLAHTDPLTGLPNRRHLNASLQAALMHCGPGRFVGVYVLDLDGFKPINDRHGHDVGDTLLAAVAQRLRAHTRASDLIARVGGDEFVLMATGLTSDEDAQEIGRKLLDAFEAPFNVEGHTLQIGMTGGYALAPADGSDLVSLMKRADAAMYAGKQAGKRCLRRAA